MLRKALLPSVLSLACLLLVTDFAHAQRRGGWGYGNGYYGRNYGYYGPDNGYYGRGYGYYGGYYRPWNYGSYPATSYYYDPAPPVYVQPAAAVDTAHVRVILPDPNARVWFDGAITQQTGTDRIFHTPSLTTGTNYTYRIRATWMQGTREVTQERAVSVTPGSTSVVDFTQATGERITGY